METFNHIYNDKVDLIYNTTKHLLENSSKKELLAAAIEKAKLLDTNKSLRLTHFVKSYWLMNLQGKVFIGNYLNDPGRLPAFFKNKKVWRISGSNEDTVGLWQLLN